MTKDYNYPITATPLIKPRSTYYELGAASATPTGSRYDSSPRSFLPIPGATPTPAYKG